MKHNALSAAKSLALAAALVLSFSASAENFIIATEGAYAPFNYLNDQGQPDGYDIAVAKEVDALLDDVSFSYQAVEWSGIFAGLDAEKYQVIVSNVARNPQREEKYLFGDVPYVWDATAVAYKKGRTDIHGLADLAGKSVKVAVGSSNAHIVESWNEQHDNAIKVIYGDGEVTKALLDVQEGRADATLVDPAVAALVIKSQDLEVDYNVAPETSIVPIYWLFVKNDAGEVLKHKVDAALKTLHENGTLKTLSERFFNGDFTTEEAVKHASQHR
ncbi:MAG: transporter substrate-binding domain-containing protein [Succinivibrio sp.]|nr:transporter substrate-binding domain-containing protein [Succinivibrio sp.]